MGKREREKEEIGEREWEKGEIRGRDWEKGEIGWDKGENEINKILGGESEKKIWDYKIIVYIREIIKKRKYFLGETEKICFRWKE